MLKKELIKEVAVASGRSQEEVRKVLDATQSVIETAISQGKEVMLFGLGKLVTSLRGPKKARHMRTGEPVMVGARRVPLFRASDSLLAAANAERLLSA